MNLFVRGVLALLPALAVAQEPVAIFSDFEHEAPEPVVAEMKAEVARIMEPTGYTFDWRRLKDADGRTTFPELVVATFKGDCRPGYIALEGDTGNALGWTHRSNGQILPFTSVDCTRVERMLGREMQGLEQPQKNRLLGRALGRVLSHELYHILGNTVRHGSWGVTRAFFSSRELAADELRLQEPETKRLRGRWTGPSKGSFSHSFVRVNPAPAVKKSSR